MSQSSYDRALQELIEQGIIPDPNANKVEDSGVTDEELQLILNMEKIAGVKYSDEQKNILLNKSNSCIIACAGSGKALANGTMVLTDLGYKPIEELHVYDIVYNDRGEEELVLGVYPQGQKEIYELTMNDGHIIKCCEDHLWTVRQAEIYTDNRGETRFSTYEMTRTVKDMYNQHKDDEVMEIEIPTVSLNMEEVELRQFDNCFGYSKEEIIKMLIEEDATEYANTIEGFGNLDSWSIIEILRSVKVKVNNPMKIKNEKLIEPIRLSIELNGGRCKIAKVGEYFEISIDGFGYSSICGIKKTGQFTEMTCIKVSGRTELFLTEHCYVTHNTTVLTNLIAKRIMTGEIKNTNKLVCTTYSKGGATEMEDRLHALLQKFGMDRPIKVATMHAFFLSIIRTFGVSMTILEESQRMKMIKDAAKEAELELRDEDLADLSNLISYQINNLMSDKKALMSEANTLDNLTLDKYAKVRKSFAVKKATEYKMDFDDMQLYLYKWLVKDKTSENEMERKSAENVRNYCQAMWDDFYIDEAQDISKIQFAIIREMIQDPNNKGKLVKNLTFVGDDDQCLCEDTTIITPYGNKKINDIKIGDKIITSSGRCDTVIAEVQNVSKKYISDKIVQITTQTGKIIKGTRDHIGFVIVNPEKDVYYNYLMYKQGIGFRIGMTSGERAWSTEKKKNGLEMRMIQEKADKMWMIRRCTSKKEALYYEEYYALKYRIPKYRFLTDDCGNGLPATRLKLEDVIKLHEELDTYTRGMEMLKSLGLDFNRPHAMSQADPDLGRYRINFNLLSDKRKDKRGIHRTVLEANTSYEKYLVILGEYLNLNLKESTLGDGYLYYRCNSTVADVDKQIEKLEGILRECDRAGLEIGVNLQARLTEKTYIEMPFAGIKEGMGIPVIEINSNGQVSVIDDTVVKVEEIDYEGYVYDLSIPDTRNFIANGVVVHNCIYKWRGADPSIILNIGNQFDMRLLMLSTNYRCAENIVNFAAESVQHNSARYSKSMKAFNKGGNVQIALCDKKDLCHLSTIALNHIKKLIENGEKVEDICVMSRNNFHLAILNNMLLHEGIYTTCTNDMKLTNSSMYKDVKLILNAVRDPYDHTIAKQLLWKVCRYMSINNAHNISKFQEETGLTLKETLAYIFRYMDRDDSVSVGKDKDGKERKINVHKQTYTSMEIRYRSIHGDTKTYLRSLYKCLCETDINKTIGGILAMYLDCAGALLYKREDKQRSIKGLCNYISVLLDKFGYDGTMEFLRITEQYEQGIMAVPGAKLTLTTIHSAKGKEWKNVIAFAVDNVTMPGTEDIKNMIKEGNTLHEINEYIDEERRLYYVELTRAKKNLLIITYKVPSVFLMESLGAIKDTGDSTNNMLIDCLGSDDYVRAQQYANIFGNDVLQEKVIDEDGEFHYDINKV